MENDFYIGAAIVELMGHSKIVGRVSKSEMGLIRVDATDPATKAIITKFYNPTAIYCITPITEDSLAMLADAAVPKPVSQWDLSAEVRDSVKKQLAANSEPDYGCPYCNDPECTSDHK